MKLKTNKITINFDPTPGEWLAVGGKPQRLSPGLEIVGIVRRGVGDVGVLVKGVDTSVYAQYNAGALRSLPPEVKHMVNRRRLRGFIKDLGLTQKATAERLTAISGTQVSLRTMQQWLAPLDAKTSRKVPGWVLTLFDMALKQHRRGGRCDEHLVLRVDFDPTPGQWKQLWQTIGVAPESVLTDDLQAVGILRWEKESINHTAVLVQNSDGKYAQVIGDGVVKPFSKREQKLVNAAFIRRDLRRLMKAAGLRAGKAAELLTATGEGRVERGRIYAWTAMPGSSGWKNPPDNIVDRLRRVVDQLEWIRLGSNAVKHKSGLVVHFRKGDGERITKVGCITNINGEKWSGTALNADEWLSKRQVSQEVASLLAKLMRAAADFFREEKL